VNLLGPIIFFLFVTVVVGFSIPYVLGVNLLLGIGLILVTAIFGVTSLAGLVTGQWKTPKA